MPWGFKWGESQFLLWLRIAVENLANDAKQVAG